MGVDQIVKTPLALTQTTVGGSHLRWLAAEYPSSLLCVCWRRHAKIATRKCGIFRGNKQLRVQWKRVGRWPALLLATVDCSSAASLTPDSKRYISPLPTIMMWWLKSWWAFHIATKCWVYNRINLALLQSKYDVTNGLGVKCTNQPRPTPPVLISRHRGV